ncbi:transglutaminase domain-containing protein [Metamycoplasma alkalescens]|uniref:transglutaminase domain-containing protein n=1 Tax=Metamycoplasma alkalescens TaxID=45363 RepID=UPI00039C2F72|nr:transglutaminase domain-containing protein [Metamycoplasma alkalescens]
MNEWLKIVKYVKKSHVQEDETAYAALVNKEAICNGYAKAFKILMEKMGIPVSIVTGKIDENIYPGYYLRHVWNLVEIDGEWYHIDTTSDRARVRNGKTSDEANYDFFLIHDDDFGMGNLFYHSFKDRLGKRYRNLKVNGFVKNGDEALAFFDKKFNDPKNIPQWFEIYANEKILMI